MTDDESLPPRLHRTNADTAAENLYAALTPGTQIQAVKLWQDYVAWASKNGLPPTSQWIWEKALLRTGMQLRTINGRRTWIKSGEFGLVSLAEDIRRLMS
jgi:hypothetical protein